MCIVSDIDPTITLIIATSFGFTFPTLVNVTEVGQRAAVAGSLWVQRRFCVYELLLTKEKFYEGTKGLCLHEDGYRSSGMDRAPIPWIVLSYHGSRGRPSPSGLALGRCHGCVHDSTPPLMC